MKIAIVTYSVVQGDGQGRVNYELAVAASRRGHKVVLLANDADVDLISRDGVAFSRLKSDGWPTALVREQIFAWNSTRQLHRRRNAFDLVIVNGFNTWAPADVNVVHFVHSFAHRALAHTSDWPGPRAWYRWLYSMLNAHWELEAFRRARTMVAVSEKVRDELELVGVSPESIHVIHNGVDTDEFRPGLVNRSSLGLPKGVLLGLFVGALRRPLKNLDGVLEALRHVPDLYLAVAGETAGSPYPRMAERLGMSARVLFLGFRPDIPDLMRAAMFSYCPLGTRPSPSPFLRRWPQGCLL